MLFLINRPACVNGHCWTGPSQWPLEKKKTIQKFVENQRAICFEELEIKYL